MMRILKLKDGTIVNVLAEFQGAKFVHINEFLNNCKEFKLKKTFLDYLLFRKAKQMTWTEFFLKIQEYIRNQNLGYYCFSEDQFKDFSEILKYGTLMLSGVVAESIANDQQCIVVDPQSKINKPQQIKHIESKIQDDPNGRPLGTDSKFDVNELKNYLQKKKIIVP